MNAALHSVCCVLPQPLRSVREIEQTIDRANPHLELPEGFLNSLAGIDSVTVAPEGTYPSDIAAEAGGRTLAKCGIPADEIDLLLFAAVSRDIIEPATANIVQQRLGLRCPVFDVNNACNSFLNAVQVAASLVRSGEYRRVLVTTGELPSRIMRTHFRDREDFGRSFSGLTLGDSGAAAIVEATEGPGIEFMRFHSFGEDWQNAMVPGGRRPPSGERRAHAFLL